MINRLLTFNLALTFLEVSGRYVKEQMRLSARLVGSVKGAGEGEAQGLRGAAWRLPAGHKGFCGAGGRADSAWAGWAVRRLGYPETSALTSRRALERFGGEGGGVI